MSGDLVSERPVVAVSMGDFAGIGPEVVVKALADPALRRRARFVVHGLSGALALEAERAGIEPFWFRVAHGSDRASRPIRESVVVLDHVEHEIDLARAHTPSKPGGHSSKAFVEAAVADAMRAEGDPRRVDAIVTAPISKTSWHLAGFDWPGHTELLAHRAKAKRVAMAFVSPRLRVVLSTIHVPLMKLRDLLTIGRVHDAIDLAAEGCRQLGLERPRIAVCGLNPHAGEGGRFGDEEIRLIEPAIELARAAGIDARGPFPADTVFNRAVDGEFDLVVAQYHDQGLIPVKLLGWEQAVNWTLGLPFVRTSPDHGTAFDIAGKGRADASSMQAALRLAVDLAEQRRAATTAR